MNLATATAAIAYYLDVDQPTFTWGPPGVGKSAAVRSIAKGRKWNVIDFRCSTRDPVALMGLPDLAGETTRWKVPDEFPQVERDGPEGILFLDELNVAAPSMQAAAFGLVLDRRVGEYVLPKGWRVLAAGNRQSDKAAAQRMPSALANRFAHIDIEPDIDTFVQWANTSGVDPLVMGFIRFRPALLHSMEGSDLRAFPTPRAWEAVSKVVDAPEEIRLSLVTGLVGEGAGAEFEGFIRTRKNLPTVEEVVKHPETAKLPTEPAARYAIAAALSHGATPEIFEPIQKYLRRLPREFEVMATVDALLRNGALAKTQAFREWAVRNQDVTFN
ncbi:MAG: AAA family ATPase [Rhizobiaceae bacterium]